MSINSACELLGYARSTFFEVRGNKLSKAEKDKIIEDFVLEKVSIIRKDLPRCGGRKMYYLISKGSEKSSYKFGRKRFFEILKAHDLLVKRRKKRIFTTDSSHWRRQYPDLVKELIPNRPEQIWVSDITYFKISGDSVYGHLITDGYSKKLMGFVVADNMRAPTTLLALKMAVKNRMYDEQLIHHSDRGFQYLSRVYTDFLKSHKIWISVTQDGSPYDNAVAERINGILKDEFGFKKVFKNLKEAQVAIEKAAKVYNNKRPHWSNHLLTPNEMHLQRNLKIKTWRIKK